ncbi:MAG: hypothetical protein RTS72_07425 [Candidatus Thorarchaeota archaeon]
MKRVSMLVALMFLSILVCTIPVSAQTDQGFEWGFAYEDEFHFMMHLNGTGFHIDEEIYIILNDTIPTIPDTMTNWTDIPYTGIWAYYANGTQLGIEILTFIAVYNVHLPIGNWALLSTLAQTTHNVENFVLDPEDPFFWGYSWDDDDWVLTDGSFTIYSNFTLNVHVEYLKTDGFLTQYSVDAYNTTTGADAGEVTLERLDMEKYRDTISPTIDNPDDISYIEGEEGNSITWYPTDDYPSHYEILIDEVVYKSGVWNHTVEAVVVSVDELSAGDYDYTCIVYDIRGNFARDDVMVTVQAEAGIPLVLISVVAGAGILVVLAVVCRRR